jgi:hypothetical protein
VCTHSEHNVQCMHYKDPTASIVSQKIVENYRNQHGMHKAWKMEKGHGAPISSTYYLVSSKEVTPSKTRPDYRPNVSSMLT